jgi:hypothetical protein
LDDFWREIIFIVQKTLFQSSNASRSRMV